MTAFFSGSKMNPKQQSLARHMESFLPEVFAESPIRILEMACSSTVCKDSRGICNQESKESE